MRHVWIVAIAIAAVSTVSARGADEPDGLRWWSHVRALADDKLEGRDTGSAGHRKAAEYVAGEFQRLGLKPAGTEGYFQPVKFLSKTIDETHSRLELVRESGTEPLELGADATVSLQVDPAPSVDAELVFAGYGLTVPDFGHDDFRDLDVRGKVVVFLSGAPRALPGPLASHAQSLSERAGALERAGAVGMVRLVNPKSMDIPWERLSLARSMPSMSLADAAMDEARGLSLALNVNPARAEKLFAGSGHTFQEVLDADDARKPLPHFAIPARIKATVAVTRTELTSQNVVAVLPGSDPEAQGRVCRPLGAPRPRRRRQADQRRFHLQRGHGQRLRRGRPARRRRDPQGDRCAAQAVAAVPGGHRRGKRPARVALLCKRAHRRPPNPSSPTSTPTCSCRSTRSRA